MSDTQAMAELPRLTLDELAALCDEIAALAHQGVPWEESLASTSREWPKRLREVALAMSERGRQGESLEQFVMSQRSQLPPMFGAIVAAGVRSGQLPAAVAGLATLSRQVAEVRRSLARALVYPAIIIVLVTALAAAFLPRIGSALRETELSARLSSGTFFSSAYSALLLGLSVVTCCAIVWWWRSDRQLSATTSEQSMPTRRTTSVRRLVELGRRVTFAETLALLVEHRVDLPEALALAADACGDQRLRRDVGAMRQQLQEGRTLRDAARKALGIPPLWRWLLQSAHDPHTLARSLRVCAEADRRRAEALAHWLSLKLPILLTVVIGGSITLLYALAALGPWYHLMTRLGESS